MRAKLIRRKGKFYIRKKCFFTENNIYYVDYKNVDILKQFLGRNGQILPNYKTDLTRQYQRQLTHAIKRARIMALLPYRTI